MAIEEFGTYQTGRWRQMLNWLFGKIEEYQEDRAVRDALCAMVHSAQITRQYISRQNISEMQFQDGENWLFITWYPRSNGGKLRTLSFNGLDSPLSDGLAQTVLDAALKRARTVFDQRAKDILAAAKQ